MCCVGLAFDKGAKFGFDKAAGEPCRHLGADNGCGIHARRARLGFSGCIDYDCLGAGQRVTALFAGRTWRNEPEQLRPMLHAFALMRRVHERLQLLEEAAKLALSPEDEARRQSLVRRMSDAAVLDRSAELEAECAAFIRSLRDYAAGWTTSPG